MDINVTKPITVEKSWGYELWFANKERENYCGKLLYIKKGYGFSMHFHKEKNETFYVLSGSLGLRVVDLTDGMIHTKTLHQGDVFDVPQYLPHQLYAPESDAIIIEASTFHRDEDSYRLWKYNEK